MLNEVARLRENERISQVEAHALRQRIRNGGSTVDEYLAGRELQKPAPAHLEVSNGQVGNPVELMQAASAILALAGSKDRALKAIEVYAELQAGTA